MEISIYPKVFALIGQKAVVKNRNGEILLIRRSQKSTRPGGWDFPGGGLEKEDPEKGIVREIKEETGLDVENVSPIAVLSLTNQSDEFIVMIGYRASAISDTVIISQEHNEYSWVSLSDPLLQELPDIHTHILKKFIEKRE